MTYSHSIFKALSVSDELDRTASQSCMTKEFSRKSFATFSRKYVNHIVNPLITFAANFMVLKNESKNYKMTGVVIKM